jgi:hypothetical protein
MDGVAGHAPSIDIVLEQFLAEQREKLAPRTIARYEEVIELLRHCLNGYAYPHFMGLKRSVGRKRSRMATRRRSPSSSAQRRSSRTTGSSSATS